MLSKKVKCKFMSAGLRKVPSISRIELKIKRTLTVLLCRGPSFFSQILRARYESHLKKIDLTSYLELLQCLRMPTLMVKFVGTIDKRLYSAFSQFHLLGLCHVKLKSTFRSCSSHPASRRVSRVQELWGRAKETLVKNRNIYP